MTKPLAVTILFLVLFLAAAAADAQIGTVVPEGSFISDDSARRTLADLYLLTGDFLSARDAFTRLTLKNPTDAYPWLGLLRAETGLREDDRALVALKRLAELRPDDPAVLLEMAWTEARLGRPRASLELYERARKVSPNQDSVYPAMADGMALWGDYYRAEAILRKYLAGRPGDSNALLRLAKLYLSSQRFQEAEAVFQEALEKGASPGEVNLGLAELKWEEEHLAESQEFSLKVLETAPAQPDALRLMGLIMSRRGDFPEALAFFQRLERVPGREAAGLVGQGRVLLAQGERKQAREKFAAAQKADPRDPDAWIFDLEGNEKSAGELAGRLAEDQAQTSVRLTAWGEAFNNQGLHSAALACFRAAWARNPDNFPARLGEAQALAFSGLHDQAVSAFDALARDYPEVPRIMLARARTLAWARRYDEAVEAFADLGRLQPIDPVPALEGARAAAWGKQMDRAWAIYAGIWRVPVDKRLALLIRPLQSESLDPGLQNAFAGIEKQGDGRRVFRGYEDFAQALGRLAPGMEPGLRADCEHALRRLRAEYSIQKAAFLEAEAKKLTWNGRFIPARERYEELISFQPWNQEAAFDLAQVECALGLCDREPIQYRRLLEIDPRHTLAGLALERQETRTHPALMVAYDYWREKGRGNASGMTRERADLELDVPVPKFSRFHLRAKGHYWWETPRRFGRQVRARGFSLEASGPVSGYVSLAAGWTWKYYRPDRLGRQENGFAEAWLNLWDYARIGGGWTREQMAANYFALEKGIQADSVWAGIVAVPVRGVEAEFRYGYWVYEDHNQEDRQSFSLGYALTEHPRVLKAIVSVERRDARKELRERYLEGVLVDMVHPYWTPREWWGGDLLLEWRHDLSRYFFCGAERHYYDLKAGVGTDNKNNPSWTLEAEWRLDFWKHWTAQVKGRMERSREWEGTGAWLSLGYLF
ncbi:MAG: tetratricopeptide repeat protein [Pseudomonadota bacterium]